VWTDKQLSLMPSSSNVEGAQALGEHEQIGAERVPGHVRARSPF